MKSSIGSNVKFLLLLSILGVYVNAIPMAEDDTESELDLQSRGQIPAGDVLPIPTWDEPNIHSLLPVACQLITCTGDGLCGSHDCGICAWEPHGVYGYCRDPPHGPTLAPYHGPPDPKP
ncbi:hypothetical protein MMC12_006264 [Toensbergia leucococca]|nr:hypothetical protein [Toensbergia leucococca]